MYQSVLVHSVIVSPLIVVDHAPEMVVKSESDESMVMVEPSERVEVLKVTSMMLPLRSVVVLVHSSTEEPSMMVIQVEVGVVKLYDESPDEMVVISPLIVVVLSVMVVVVKELSMMVVVHASNDSPETVV